MKKSVKAALFSGLVFPGVGQFSLKRYARGLIFFLPAMSSLVFMLDHSMRNAFSIVDKIERGEVPLDPDAIANLISATASSSDSRMLAAAQWLIVLCWVVSIIDAYRLGIQADQSDQK
jgi:hypothetical protein